VIKTAKNGQQYLYISLKEILVERDSNYVTAAKEQPFLRRNTIMENNVAAKEPITGDMLISEIISKHQDAIYLLMNCGMGCVSCPASQMESLTEACMVHGLDGKEVARHLNVELGLVEA
jgi:hybrid cluster-associated redox disulfide protein